MNLGLALEGAMIGIRGQRHTADSKTLHHFVSGWTGGLFKATLHRVITQQTPEGGYKQRFSIAYFVQPVDEVVLNPISPDGTIDVTPGAQTSRDFYEARMAASQAAALA